jgi:hypothetical protein
VVRIEAEDIGTQLTLRAAVKLYHSLGLNVVPLALGKKTPLVENFYEKPPTNEIVDYYVLRGCNIGLVCGILCVQDFERYEDAVAFYGGSLEKVASKTIVVLTPHDGVHVYWLNGKPIPRKIRLAEDHPLDLLGMNTYVVAPPSVINHSFCDKAKCHKSRSDQYRVLGTWQIEIFTGSLLQATLKRCKELGWRAKAETTPSIRRILQGIHEGFRNVSAFKYARHLLFTVGLDFDTAWFELQRWNALNKPPLPEKELLSVLKSAAKYGSEPPVVRVIRSIRSNRSKVDSPYGCGG